MRKLLRAGYQGDDHTQDIGGNNVYNYHDLTTISRAYQAILCLDVTEHLVLRDGLALVDRLVELLSPEGRANSSNA